MHVGNGEIANFLVYFEKWAMYRLRLWKRHTDTRKNPMRSRNLPVAMASQPDERLQIEPSLLLN